MKRILATVAAMLAMTALALPAPAASVVTINGKSYTCSGSLVATNGKVSCDGVDISAGPRDDLPCGKDVAVITYTNPDGSKGGRLARRVQIGESETIHISADSVLCGALRLEGKVRIESSRLADPGSITGLGSKGVVIRQSVVNGRITARGDGILIEKSVINGELAIRDAAQVKDSVVNGRSDLSGLARVRNTVVNGDTTLKDQDQLGASGAGR